jgi:DNA-binding NtrC family response regulator
MSERPKAESERRCSVILVEDYAMLAQIRARGLERLGCSVHISIDAESALRYLAANRADVVVADLRLPGRDGVALLNEAQRLYPGIGRLLITGQITDEAREWASRQTPPVPVILKGEDAPDVLPRAVLRACAHHGS